MDQAAQPARASTAAPAHSSTFAHTAAPTTDFWAETMKAPVFWSAASAVATALAVGAAFLVPLLSDRRQQRRQRRYAVQMLQPVFAEAVRFADDAAAICAMCDRGLARHGENTLQGAVGPFGAELSPEPWTGLLVFNGSVPQQIDRFVSADHMQEYRDNRQWLADLHPREAGLIQNSLAKSVGCLRKMEQLRREWPDNHVAILPTHVREVREQADNIREIMGLAARILGAVVGEKTPDAWDKHGTGSPGGAR